MGSRDPCVPIPGREGVRVEEDMRDLEVAASLLLVTWSQLIARKEGNVGVFFLSGNCPILSGGSVIKRKAVASSGG